MQNALSIRIKFRPIKLGWCIRGNNFQELEKAMRLSHTLWGGRYNPIIPVNDATYGRILVNTFRVDALYALSDDPEIKKFLSQFPWLPWPLFHKELFINGTDEKLSTLLDVQHPLRYFFEQSPIVHLAPTLLQWDSDDPLATILTATLGAYPSKDETGHDYDLMFEKYLNAVKIPLNKKSVIPNDLHKRFSPNSLSEVFLHKDCHSNRIGSGFYFGDSNDFEDIVNFWNLRASDIDLFFYDPKHANRLDGLKDEYIKALESRPRRDHDPHEGVAVWGKNHEILKNASVFGPRTMKSAVGSEFGDGGVWNGLNIKPPIVYFESRSSLATVTDSKDQPTISFQLPETPFSKDVRFCHQHAIASIWPITDISDGGDWTLQVPYIPELNEHFGRECHFSWNEARAEHEGLGIVIRLTHDIITLRALNCRELISKIFDAWGMRAEPSQAGLICSRIVQQMERLQGCRVFKIPGTRKLIEEFGPDQHFTKKQALPMIGKSNFSYFKHLFIERRTHAELSPPDVLNFLTKQGVLRVGIELKCLSCELSYWTQIDDLKTEMVCEYCGNKFDVTSQLPDRNCWEYRRSGLFGKTDHQEGSIPALLTLLQLDTVLHMKPLFYATAMKIYPVKALIDECETDFVVIAQGYKNKVQVVIGESKTRKEITEDDVTHLTKVADSFSKERFDVFILFSKAGVFSPEEIKRCRRAQDPYRQRVIMLSERELEEPHFIYERAEREFAIDKTVIALDGMAKNTEGIFLNPRSLSVK